ARPQPVRDHVHGKTGLPRRHGLVSPPGSRGSGQAAGVGAAFRRGSLRPRPGIASRCPHGRCGMSAGRTEFSRVVPLARLGAEPFRQEIVATEAERAVLARRFDLVSLERLNASVELARRAHDLILLTAAFEAEFQQSCVVTLDPVPGAVSERFSLLYGPPEVEEGAIGAEDDVAFEPLTGDAIDIGEAVAQEFS